MTQDRMMREALVVRLKAGRHMLNSIEGLNDKERAILIEALAAPPQPASDDVAEAKAAAQTLLGKYTDYESANAAIWLSKLLDKLASRIEALTAELAALRSAPPQAAEASGGK